MNVALFILALPICIADLSTFVIPNIYTKILFYLTLIHLSLFGFGNLGDVVVSLAALLLLILIGIGMGDVKLLGVLAISVLPSETDAYMIFLLTVAVSASAHALFLSRGDLRISLQIPLAPAIFCGTIAALIAK